MASVASGQSPHLGYNEEENWQFVDMVRNENSQSIEYYSPETGSMQSYAILGPNPNQQQQLPEQQQPEQHSHPQTLQADVSPLLPSGHFVGNYSSADFPAQEFSTSVPTRHGFDLATTEPHNGHTTTMSPADMNSFLMAQEMILAGSSPLSPFDHQINTLNGKMDWPQMQAPIHTTATIGPGAVAITTTSLIQAPILSSPLHHTDISPVLDPFNTNVTSGTDFSLPAPAAPVPGEDMLNFDTSMSEPAVVEWGDINTFHILKQMNQFSVNPPQTPVSPTGVLEMHSIPPMASPGASSSSMIGEGITASSLGIISDRASSTSSTAVSSSLSAIKKKRNDASTSLKSTNRVTKSSSRKGISSAATTAASQFVIVTPNTISQAVASGKPGSHMYECFEAMRGSQKGRKGPLANEVKESALLVRRLGACFCCHARKVKCDKERPCRNCKKLITQVPGVVCWQFQDFMPVLFPEFVREHFRKEEMHKFMSEHVGSFPVGLDETVNGIEIELSAGMQFSTKLRLRAKIFTARTDEVLKHWHLRMASNKDMVVDQVASVPLGVELDATMRDDLRKRIKEFVGQLVHQEPYYAEQMTDSFRHTLLPRRILKIVHSYNRDAFADAAGGIVRRALAIYALHYMMSRHLTLTPQSIAALPPDVVPASAMAGDVLFITPRVLNRQIKSLVDELMVREMQLIFEQMSKMLKPKTRREWAPCMAAFLVLCLFMEEVETAADRFVITENEIYYRSRRELQRKLREQKEHEHTVKSLVGEVITIDTTAGVANPQQQTENEYVITTARTSSKMATVAGAAGMRNYRRAYALRINREIEKLPFRQVAYQFHQIYQTHSKDGITGLSPSPGSSPLSSGSGSSSGNGSNYVGGGPRAFNPLVDDSALEELDGPAMEMALRLRELIHGESWAELDFLSMDPMLPHGAEEEIPRASNSAMVDDGEEEAGWDESDSHPFPRDVAYNYTGKLVSKFLLSFQQESYILDGNI